MEALLVVVPSAVHHLPPTAPTIAAISRTADNNVDQIPDQPLPLHG
jgi:hypothetical protein